MNGLDLDGVHGYTSVRRFFDLSISNAFSGPLDRKRMKNEIHHNFIFAKDTESIHNGESGQSFTMKEPEYHYIMFI